MKTMSSLPARRIGSSTRALGKVTVLVTLLAALASPSPAEEVLLDFGATWSFFRGSEPPSVPDETAWRTPGFDDGGWEIGAAGFGYGDNDDATVLDDMEDSYASVYVRTTFDVTNAAGVASLLLSVSYDDGFVMYVNGVEAQRAGMGAVGEEFAYDDLATVGHEADGIEYFDLSAQVGLLQDGENLVAVEIHNVNLDSSDLSFDMRLSTDDPRSACVEAITCTKSTNSVTLSWDTGGAVEFSAVDVTRNGVPIAGSPFSGPLTSVIDANPGNFVNDYEVTFTIDGAVCDNVLTCSTDQELPLIAVGDDWRFLRGTVAPSDPSTAWREPLFDDSAWEEGPTGIGYADGDDATELTDMMGNYTSVYLRKRFRVESVTALSSLALTVGYDDGFVAYLNGVEVARSANMGAPGTELVYTDVAQTGHEVTSNGGSDIFDISGFLSELENGDNLLAIEVFNVDIDSSDLSILPDLSANSCNLSATCTYDDVEDSVTIEWSGIAAETVAVLRNGTPIAGSPFAGDQTSATDATPDSLDNVYEVVATVAGGMCPAATCTITCATREPDALSCTLALVDGATQALLDWTTPAGVESIELSREGAAIATLAPTESSYVDPDVESDEAEDDTGFEVEFVYPDQTTCTISCNASLCPENLVCDIVDVGGQPRARLSWDNMVKNWESITIEGGGGEIIAQGLAPDSMSFTDTTTVLIPGVAQTYTLVPVAPPGGEVGGACDSTCMVTLPLEELADYEAPPGGWDYRADFNVGDDAYNPITGETGNLDGSWIRAIDLDSWDGSAPLEVGAVPDGAAPGGIAVESVVGGGPCGDAASVLRILDPGDPSAPGASLATEYPEPFDEPNNRVIFLGLDTGVSDRNLLRDGVTLAMRWRVNPAAPAYLAANPTGDGSPITNGLGQIGIYFLDDGTLGTAGLPAALAFSLQSTNQELQVSTEPQTGIQGVDLLTFRSLWVTIEDPEGDDTYDLTFYVNGQTQPFPGIGVATDVALQAASFDVGLPAGNVLGIGLPNGGNDADIQIDYIAYKEGVHLPAASPCEPVEGPVFRRGDVDGNGVLEITDVVNDLAFQFLGQYTPVCLKAHDFDDNGLTEITDAVNSLGHQFLGDPPPPAPGTGTCGPDPTPDSLDCTAYPPASCN